MFLEHVYEPRQTLDKVAKLLKKGGTVMISCPNIDGLGAKLFRKKWYAIDVPRHLYQFNSSTIGRMLKGSGLKIGRLITLFTQTTFMFFLKVLGGHFPLDLMEVVVKQPCLENPLANQNSHSLKKLESW